MIRKKYKNKFSLAVFSIFAMLFLFSVNPNLLKAEPVITGIINDFNKKKPLENINIRILNSGFKTKSDKQGQFELPFVPGNFNVIFEGIGVIPKRISLSLSSERNYPMGEINLYPFPTLIDMYKKPIEGVELTIQQASYESKGILISSSITNSEGLSLIEYAEGNLEIVTKKAGYKTRLIELNFEQPQKLLNYKWMLPPEKSGLYYHGNYLNKTNFEFIKKGMSGMTIPVFYDGKYSVNSKPLMIELENPLIFYWIPEYPATLGNNFFASKESIFIYKVSSDGTFVIYDKGRSEGEKVEILKFNNVCNEVDSKFEGFIQQKIQIFQIEQELPVGEYVLFQGSSNSQAREPYPEENLRCWHFKIIDKNKM